MTAINFSLTESLLQIQSTIFTLENLLPSEFTAESQGGGGAGSDNVFFLLFNSFNNLLDSMRQSSALYVSELIDRSNQKNQGSMIIFILSIILLSLMVAVLVPVVASVNRNKSEVLSLFCDIEEESLRKLAIRCERFLTVISKENNKDDAESNNEEMLIDENGGLNGGS